MVGSPRGHARMRVGRADQGSSANLPPVVDAVPYPQFVARRTRYSGPTQFYAALCRLRCQCWRRQLRSCRCGRRCGCVLRVLRLLHLLLRTRRMRGRLCQCCCRCGCMLQGLLLLQRSRRDILRPCACLVVGVDCVDSVVVICPDGNVRVRVRRAGQVVPADLLPAVDAVPNPQLIAHSLRYRCPTQFYRVLSRLRGQGRRRGRRRGYGHRRILRPCARLAVGVDCADGVIVGRPGSNIRVRVARASQVVSANLPPIVDAVPYQQLVAHRTRYRRPTQVHFAFAGLRG